MFNVRVYGILIYNNAVLLADESYNNKSFTKFPGGGLQFGESTIDCLKREMLEEYGWRVEVNAHFYTTDFFVPSVFDTTQQVISVFYFISVKHELLSFEKLKAIDGSGFLRWQTLAQLKADDFTFPIEKKVAQLLQQSFSN
jgi:8-oxo-dGTP diphosphatase